MGTGSTDDGGGAVATWEALRLMKKLNLRPRRTVRAPRIMGEAYRLILANLVARGWSPPRAPIHLPRMRLLWIILRHAFI